MNSLEGSCLCTAVRLTLPHPPQVATDCNCSSCRRRGALWVYYPMGSVLIRGHPQHTREYVWGDRTLQLFFCATCACVTHWDPLPAGGGTSSGVNLRNFDPALLAAVRVRHFDGADTWKFLD